MHGLNHNAFDPAAGKIYHRPFGDMTVRKYDVATATRSDLPRLPFPVMRYNSCCVAIAWFPERNALEYVSIENGTLGAVAEYRESTGQWMRMAGSLPMGAYQSFGKYDRINRVLLFGGGEGDRHVYKMDGSGAVTAMQDAPVGLGILDSVVTSDPVSGQFLILGNRNFYAYDVNEDSWTQLPVTPLLSPPTYTPAVHGIAVTPIPEYGVNFYARCYVDDCHAYLYKHAVATPAAIACNLSSDTS